MKVLNQNKIWKIWSLYVFCRCELHTSKEHITHGLCSIFQRKNDDISSMHWVQCTAQYCNDALDAYLRNTKAPNDGHVFWTIYNYYTSVSLILLRIIHCQDMNCWHEFLSHVRMMSVVFCVQTFLVPISGKTKENCNISTSIHMQFSVYKSKNFHCIICKIWNIHWLLTNQHLIKNSKNLKAYKNEHPRNLKGWIPLKQCHEFRH